MIALGGGAVETAAIRQRAPGRGRHRPARDRRGRGLAPGRRSGRPLAADEASFRDLHERRAPIYQEVADAVASNADDAVLAAGGVQVELGGIERLALRLPEGPGRSSPTRTSPASTAPWPSWRLATTCGDARATGRRGSQDPRGRRAALALLLLPRGGMLVALGGGCVTDAAGFVAATYLRGIPWVAVPSTLVGQVDAGIGGKTAIDLPEGKNLVGAFHWPARTVIDPGLLATLPAEERSEGMAEVVKTGLLVGDSLWELPEPELVRRCAAFKTAICIRDPREHGERKALNLGHTFAHALEAASDYRLRHGEAVALGLLAALRLSGLPDRRRRRRARSAAGPRRPRACVGRARPRQEDGEWPASAGAAGARCATHRRGGSRGRSPGSPPVADPGRSRVASCASTS